MNLYLYLKEYAAGYKIGVNAMERGGRVNRSDVSLFWAYSWITGLGQLINLIFTCYELTVNLINYNLYSDGQDWRVIHWIVIRHHWISAEMLSQLSKNDKLATSQFLASWLSIEAEYPVIVDHHKMNNPILPLCT